MEAVQADPLQVPHRVVLPVHQALQVRPPVHLQVPHPPQVVEGRSAEPVYLPVRVVKPVREEAVSRSVMSMSAVNTPDSSAEVVRQEKAVTADFAVQEAEVHHRAVVVGHVFRQVQRLRPAKPVLPVCLLADPAVFQTRATAPTNVQPGTPGAMGEIMESVTVLDREPVHQAHPHHRAGEHVRQIPQLYGLL